MSRKRNAAHLTFSDALAAAIYLAKQKGHPKGKTWKNCPACKKTLKILSAAKKQFEAGGYGRNLIWTAYKAQSRK